jgi:hypothetical protein
MVNTICTTIDRSEVRLALVARSPRSHEFDANCLRRMTRAWSWSERPKQNASRECYSQHEALRRRVGGILYSHVVFLTKPYKMNEGRPDLENRGR